MSEYETYYREVACNSSTWADPEADLCGCHGGGWWSSEVDTWHLCPFHGRDAWGNPQPHPDDYEEEEFIGPTRLFTPPDAYAHNPDDHDDNIPF